MSLEEYRKDLEKVELMNYQSKELLYKITSRINHVKTEMKTEIDNVYESMNSLQNEIISEYTKSFNEFLIKLLKITFFSSLPLIGMEFILFYCDLSTSFGIILRILQVLSFFIIFFILIKRFNLKLPTREQTEILSYSLLNLKENLIPKIEVILSEISSGNEYIKKIREIINKNINYSKVLEDELSNERNRLLALSKVIATFQLMDIDIDAGIMFEMMELKDEDSMNALVINRFEILQKHYHISQDIMIFIFYLFQDHKKSTMNNWNKIKNKPNQLEELLEIFREKSLLPDVNYNIELQKKIVQQFNHFDLSKIRERLIFGEKLINEIERINSILEKEGFEPLYSYQEKIAEITLESYTSTLKVDVLFRIVDELIDVEAGYSSFITSVLLVLYTDEYYPILCEESIHILSEDVESMELLFLWVLNQENRIFEKSFSRIFQEWLDNKKEIKLTIPLDYAQAFKYFIRDVKEGIFSKDIQLLFERSIDKLIVESHNTKSDLTIKVRQTNLRIDKLLPSFFVRRISFSSLIRLLKKTELIIYTIMFKSAKASRVKEVLEELKQNVAKEGFQTEWRQYTLGSRIGVIRGEDFDVFKEFLNRELGKYKEFEKASIALNVFFPSEEITLEYGTIEIKKVIKDIMKQKFHLNEEEIISALKYDLEDYGILDIIRETSYELTLGDFIEYSEVKGYLNIEDFKILRDPSITQKLLEELDFGSLFELMLEVSSKYEYKEKIGKFLSQFHELQNYSEKIAELLYRKLDGIIQKEPEYTWTYQKVRKQIWEGFSSNEFLKQLLKQNERFIEIIVKNVINYHTTLIEKSHEVTSKFKNEYEFQDHLYDYLSRPDRIGSGIINPEDKKSKGLIDFRIYGIPTEIKFIPQNKVVNYSKYKEEKLKETKQYIVDREHNLGFLIIMDTTPQEFESEADLADYYSPIILKGGKGKEVDNSQYPIGVIVIHLLGGERTQVSRIKE